MGDPVEFVGWGARGFKVMGVQNAFSKGGAVRRAYIYIPVE